VYLIIVCNRAQLGRHPAALHKLNDKTQIKVDWHGSVVRDLVRAWRQSWGTQNAYRHGQ